MMGNFALRSVREAVLEARFNLDNTSEHEYQRRHTVPGTEPELPSKTASAKHLSWDPAHVSGKRAPSGSATTMASTGWRGSSGDSPDARTRMRPGDASEPAQGSARVRVPTGT